MPADCPESDRRRFAGQNPLLNRTCEAFQRPRGGPGIRSRSRITWNPAGRPARQDAIPPELLGLEIELRREGGETPAVEDYVARFPAQEDIVRDVFSEVASTQGDGRDTARAIAEAATVRPATDGSGTAEFSANSTIGEYELIEELARGGMGVVYKARHRGLKRLVALKMILSGSMATFEERERFLREAELAANLDHPNIVPIYEVDEHEDRPYFSMKLVDGGSLSRQGARFRDDPCAPPGWSRPIARARSITPHGKAFLHCDLKPSNVLLDTRENPYVTDFGLARRAGADSSLSISGAILGTPSYMAPEQAAGSRATSARRRPTSTGLGAAILYELLAGRARFRSPTIMETIVQVMSPRARPSTPPRGLRPEIPRELEGICLKCLEKAAKDRYPTAEVLAERLDHYLRGETIAAAELFPRLRRWNRREAS